MNQYRHERYPCLIYEELTMAVECGDCSCSCRLEPWCGIVLRLGQNLNFGRNTFVVNMLKQEGHSLHSLSEQACMQASKTLLLHYDGWMDVSRTVVRDVIVKRDYKRDCKTCRDFRI